MSQLYANINLEKNKDVLFTDLLDGYNTMD